MYQVFIINKSTGQEVKVIESGLTKSQAESICEQWGWNYSDENGISFWMDYRKEF